MERVNTVGELLLARVKATPDKEAYRYPSGTGWASLSWRDLERRVRDISCGLRALGLQDEERCSILSGTRMEWILADLGTLCAGGATTTIYPASTPDECAYIASDSGSSFVFAENDEHVQKLANKRAALGKVRHVIVFEGKGSGDGWVIPLSALEEKGRAVAASQPKLFEETIRKVRKDSLATLIYTSGTTGRPKGVELTHDCWTYEAEGIDALGILLPDDLQYLWLPLAHVFGKVLEVAQLRIGFTTAVDGRVDKLVDNLAVVRPTFVAAVPRIFEKVHNKVVSGAQEAGGLKLKIFQWAFSVGKQVSLARQQGRMVGPLLAAQNAVATKLVFSKLHARFGGRLRFFVSGSAPLSRSLAEWFHAAGILILEGYGMTESSAGSCVNVPHRFRFGTVGPAMPGTEVKIAEDGEILLKGRGIMRGYHNLPAETAQTLDKDGWLHTGDIGRMEDGLLRITDRKKDLFKTSAGKYIAPTELENKLKVVCPYVSHVVAHGENRNFVSMLVALDPDAVKAWAEKNGQAGKSYQELVSAPAARELVAPYISSLNQDLARHETIKKFTILPADLTIDSGELTPSMKVKRKAVEQKYKHLLDDMYKGSMVEA